MTNIHVDSDAIPSPRVTSLRMVRSRNQPPLRGAWTTAVQLQEAWRASRLTASSRPPKGPASN
jgi:hypothetical protein